MKTAIAILVAGLMLATAAAAQSSSPDPIPPWNVNVDGRLLGVVDRNNNQQTLGNYVTLSADKGLSEWLTLGLGANYEHLTTRNWSVFGAVTNEDGWGLQPYATARLTPHAFFTAFASAMRLSYDASLGSGVTAQFGGWRWLAGGNLLGIWRQDQWRLQPSLTMLYGEENQEAYTTSAGAAVAPVSLPFGRISLGPEIGYAITRPEAWALEPFVFAKGNYDYVRPGVAVVSGGTFTSSQQGPFSASLGGGAQLNTKQGFNARLQVSNESVGQAGLDVWLGQVRGGWKF